MFETFVITLFGVALAQASPGPNFLAVVRAGLGQGRKMALYTVMGVATGMLVWATMVAFGLAVVLAVYPALLTTLKIYGGAYLLYMAYKAIKSSFYQSEMSIKADEQEYSPSGAWLHGLLVIMTNPKAALMWTAVGSFLFGNGFSAVQVLAFGPIAALSATLIYGSYALMFTTGLAVKAYSRFARWIELMFGTVFGMLGGKLIVDGIKEIKQ